jgi:uncharacterized sulfatase
MPLAISWPKSFPGGRTVDDIVSLIDVTATIYDTTGVQPPSVHPIAGRSLVNVLDSEKDGVVDGSRDAAFSGRERHSSSRFNSLGYPQRSLRTDRFLYIRNFRPERWPAGTPRKIGSGGYPKAREILSGKPGPMHGGYHDIDACPTLTFLIDNHNHPQLGSFLNLSVDRRPARELFDIQADPGCLRNLADSPDFESVLGGLDARLMAYLRQTDDPRVAGVDGGDIFETYPRYSGLRWFPTPDWASDNPDRVPHQDWLEEKRPRDR